MESLKDVIEKTKDVKPMAVVDGVKVVTFEEQRDLAQMAIMENRKIGGLQINPDGSVARTPVEYSAVNPDVYYANRACKIKDELFVVTDSRCISEQSAGNVYLSQVPASVIIRDKDGQLRLDRKITVSDDDFVSKFTDILDNEAMALIKPLIDGGVGMTTKPLPI